MGNQAGQRQELELWPMTGPSGNARAGRADSGGGKVSNYRTNTRTGGQRSGNAARARNPGSQGQIRMIDPNRPRTPDRRGGAGGRRTGAVRTGVPGTGNGRAQPARAARPAYAGSGRQGAVSPRARSNAQASKKKKAGRRTRAAQTAAFLWIAAMTVAIVFMGKIFLQNMQKSPVSKDDKTEQSPGETLPVADSSDADMPEIQEDFLTVSEYNRPGTPLASVRNIFVHYTANPGTSAAQNRSYFENLGQTHERAASAHFIIGYEGEIIQCIPLEEEAYAVMERNGDSVSIECCYLEKDGSFTQETYNSLVRMLAWLTEKYGLEPQDILRHYDCGGKKCPLYYVEHEDAWERLLEDVRQYKNKTV